METVASKNTVAAGTQNIVLTLDERINSANMENYEEILQEISQFTDEIIQEIYIKKLSVKLDVSIKALTKRLKAITPVPEGGNSRLCAVFDRLVDLVENNDGEVRYLVKGEDGLEVVSEYYNDNVRLLPPQKNHLQFELVKGDEVVQSFSNLNLLTLVSRVISYLKRFSYLPDEYWLQVSLFTILTHIQDHQQIRYFPMLYFYAVAERGKSRTAKAILYISYRGVHLTDLKPANMFRLSENLNGSMFLDITDITKTSEKSDTQDILLNRFEKGAKIFRVTNPDKGAFEDQTAYNVYGPTIVATNEPANLTFESRCLSITMVNRPGDYEDPTPELGLELKTELTAFRAYMMDRPLPQVDPISGISGRMWDITKPLFQLCRFLAPEQYNMLADVIRGMTVQKHEDKKDSTEGRIVHAISELAEFGISNDTRISVEKIKAEYNKGQIERYHISSPKIGLRIKSLGIRSKPIRGLSQITITKPQLELLKEQYGLTAPGNSLPLPPTHTDSDGLDSEIERELSGSDNQEDQVSANNSQLIQQDTGDGESGRELQDGSAEKHSEYLDLIGTDDQEPSTDEQPVKPKRKPLLAWA